MFDVNQVAMTGQWDDALTEAAQSALAAKNDDEIGAIAKRMVARLDPPLSTIQATTAPAKEKPALSIVGGQVIASCAGIARAADATGQFKGDTKEFAAAARRGGIIFDCRGFPKGEEGGELGWAFQQAFPTFIKNFLDRPVERGSIRLRFHDGYPPDQGGTSGGYTRGVIDQALGQLGGAAPKAARPLRFAFIADSSSPDLSSIAGGLRSAGIARLIAQRSLRDEGISLFQSKHVSALVKTADYVEPTGRMGFRPDGCVGADAGETSVLKFAAAALRGGKLPACLPAAGRRKLSSAPVRNPGTDSAPSLGERIVALAKLWGTFEYFHPYKDLNDRPWESELEEFVPIFAAADSRAAYEDAVKRLAARADDSHVRVNGLKAAQSITASVPIYVQPVESGFAVAGVDDPMLEAQVHIGDEILAVDGKPAKDVASSFASFIATSTPQWLALMQAGLILRGPKDVPARVTLRRGDSPPFDVVAPRSLSFAPRPKPDQPSFHRIGSDIGYIDLDRLAPNEADRAIDELMNTRAIIFDLRGYPQGTGFTIAPRLALPGRDEAINALFRRPIYTGPGEPQQEWKSFAQRLDHTDKSHYRGKVIVLIDARAISQSEHTAMMFEAAANPIFVGTPTAGANGDTTTVELPGGLWVSFTGHDVRHADGRQLQRVGIQPNVLVAPTFQGMQSGRDEVLEAGLAIARKP